MPKRKSDQDRGYYGVWLRLGREKLGWTQKEVVTRLHELGVPVEYDYYRQVEAGPGKRFGPDIHDVLVDLFGTEPEPLVEVQPASDTADLVAAIHAQAAAIDRLAAALEQDRADAPVWAQAVVNAVLAGRQLLREDAGSDGPHGSGAPHQDRALA